MPWKRDYMFGNLQFVHYFMYKYCSVSVLKAVSVMEMLFVVGYSVSLPLYDGIECWAFYVKRKHWL